MVIAKIRPQPDGTLVLPAEISRQWVLDADTEIIIEEVAPELPGDAPQFILKRACSTAELLARRRRHLQNVEQAFEKLKALWDNELGRWLQFVHIRSELHGLWAAHRHEDRFFAQGAMLLETAAVNLQRDTLRYEHINAFLNALHILGKDSLTGDDVSFCYKRLRESGLRLMIELDQETLQLYHEDL